MTKKMLRITAIYTAALVIGLGIYAYLCYGNLETYRYAAKYGSQRSVEETVTAVRSMSDTLKKSAYATDGAMCGKLCAKSYADAQAAQAALSTLPFSTQELERLSGFLGVAGDYAYTLCSQAAEQGFTQEQLKTLSRLSDTADGLAQSLTQIQSDLNDRLLTIDSSELRLANVGVEDTEKLSARMLGYEAKFPSQTAPEYDGKYGKGEKSGQGRLTDTQKLAAAADFAGVGLGELKHEYDYEGEDGRRCYTAGRLELCVSDRGVESMSQDRLVSGARISGEKAKEIAARFLNAHGYDSVELVSAVKNGAVEQMSFARSEDGALWADELLRISVALDDGSVYAFDAAEYSGEEGEFQWSVTQEQAEQTLPERLEAVEARKAVIRSEGGSALPCWQLKCADGDTPVTIYVHGETGKQIRIEM